MTIKDFGTKVVSIWEGLRPLTKKMLVGAMIPNITTPKQKFSYDAHADWELSRLLGALDEQLKQPEVKADTAKYREISQLAETCINVLESQTESAEIFIQLANRLLAEKNYRKLDSLANILNERFSVGEMCEIFRQAEEPAIRAIAMETIALMPVEEIINSLEDPIYEDIARSALVLKAGEYEDAEARKMLEMFDSTEFEDQNDD